MKNIAWLLIAFAGVFSFGLRSFAAERQTKGGGGGKMLIEMLIVENRFTAGGGLRMAARFEGGGRSIDLFISSPAAQEKKLSGDEYEFPLVLDCLHKDRAELDRMTINRLGEGANLLKSGSMATSTVPLKLFSEKGGRLLVSDVAGGSSVPLRLIISVDLASRKVTIEASAMSY